MARILAVGVATLDIINSVTQYPAENSELRASAQALRRGGNATNTLVVLSQLGHECAWAGTLADDANSMLLGQELDAYGIDVSAVQTVRGATTPTSYIILSQGNGSRSIVHYRDLREYGLADFRAVPLATYDWLHFEGRHVAETRAMLAYASETAPQLPRSVEIEKPRDGIEDLFAHAQILFFSRQYAEHCGYNDASGGARAFVGEMQRRWPGIVHVCSWGESGAWAAQGDGRETAVYHSPAFVPPQLVDTLAAGDTFNAAMIDAHLKGLGLRASLQAACRLAGCKCGQQGLAGLAARCLGGQE